MAETNITTQPVILQIPTTLKSLVEALIFGARDPLTVRQLQTLYEDQGPEQTAEPRKVSYEEIAKIVEDLNGEYAATDRPYRIIQLAGGYQFATQPAYAEWLGKMYKEQTRRKLSQSSIETLAIIAYKQPITKPELEAIRGVNCDYVLKTLLEKDLATIVGRAPSVGRPLLYGTTKEFLKHFGLNDLSDLPRPREIQEILGESQFESERRMLEAQQSMDEVKKEDDFKSRLPHIPKRKAGLDDEVKIIPKKRIREIKMRQPEESEPVIPQETKEPEAITDASVITSAALPEDHDVMLSEAGLTSQEDVPAIEDALSDQVTPAAAESAPLDQSMSPDESRYISLTQRQTPQEHEPPVAEEVSFVHTESDDRAEVEAPLSPATLEPEVLATSHSPLKSEVPPVAEIEPTLAIEDAAEHAALGEHIEVHHDAIDPDITSELPAEIESNVVQTPHVVSPINEELAESVGHAESDEFHEEVSGPDTSSQPKTRWKSWKEKIQGFIKKLFG